MSLITGEKTPEQLAAMRECGRLLATIFDGLKDQVKAGISELELDDWVAKEIIALGAEATYKTPEVNFPGVVCISTNSQVVHSVPSSYSLRQGDVVSFDLVISYKGVKTDSAFTVCVDESPSGDAKRLIEFTERSLYAGIDAIKGVTKTGDIAAAIQEVLEAGRLGIVRELVGHGIGLKMHMPPDIPNYGVAGSGVLLQPGDTVAIEPMAVLGGERIVTEPDNWTISTRDGGLAAHFEHTVLVTETGAEVLTQL